MSGLRSHVFGAAGRLVLISFLSLYLELTFIRWAPMQVRLLAYFSNYVLIAALLGLGLGMMLAGRARRLILFFPLALTGMVVAVLVLEARDFVVPLVTEGQFVWNYLAEIQASGLAAYGVLVGFFLAVAGLFALIGQEVGRALQPFASLRAYSLNIFGSLLGVAGFALVSFLEAPPSIWFAVGAVVFLAYIWGADFRPATIGLAAVCLAATVVIVGADSRAANGAHRYWSPYYEIETTPIVLNGRTIGSNITVNKDSHQQALDLSQQPATDPYIAGRARLYDLPYAFATPERVLIVGAGTGNDTAAALRNAPDASIDAVEIDPVIARLGSSLHPERPYDSSAVNVIIDDARSFLQKSDEPYDLIVFGFLDSHRLFSQMSSVRMDNYVYTRENFRRVRDRLTDDGVVAVTFTIHEKWIADRIFTVMTDAFGHPPLVYQGDANGWGTTFLIGREPLTVPAGATVIDPATAETEVFADRSRITWRYSETEGYLDAALFSDRAELLTDDWPFLYMRSRTIPPNYLLALILTFLGSLAAGVADGAVDRHEASVQLELLRARRGLRPAGDARHHRDRAGVRVHLADQHDRDRRHPHHDPPGQPGRVAVASSAPVGLCRALRGGAHRLRLPAPAAVGPELRGAGARRRAPRRGPDVLRRDHLRPLVREDRHAERSPRREPHRRRPRRPARVPLPRDRPATALPAGAPLLRRCRQQWRGARHRPSTNSSRPAPTG